MAQQFEDIVVLRFTTSEASQDREHKAVFLFEFMLSRSAPSLWVQIGNATWGGHANPVIGRRLSFYSDRIVVRCTANEAQRIKDNLNIQILPAVNEAYGREAGAAQARAAAGTVQQQKTWSEVERVIRNQT